MHSIGIIGYGGFGQFLHHSWQELSEVQVRAVADQDPNRQPPDSIHFYQDWRELIQDPNVDILSIATPPSTHQEIACAALKAGKHLLIEKPLAISAQEAREIIKIQKETGKVATINYLLRFNPIVETLAELSRKKVFGELRRVAVENYAQDELLPPEHWFWQPKISGGILIEHAVHFIDLVHYLSDQEHQWVSGTCQYRNPQQEDTVIANILYDRGLIATHYHSFTRPGFFERTSVRLVYDLAQLDIEGWIPLNGTLHALVNSETRRMLESLPNLELTEDIGIEEAKDHSRPEGWGKEDILSKKESQVFSRGIPYPITHMISARFDLKRTKKEVYAESLRSILVDVIRKIKDPSHQLRVTLEDGLSSLEIAETAAACGRKYRRG